MFEELTTRLEAVLKNLRGQGRLTEQNIDESLRQVRRALLEADVNFRVAREFIENVKQKALGQGVLKSLTPGQQMVGIVHQELIVLMGEQAVELSLAPAPPTILMLVGLQGSGKTTASGKLARLLRGRGHHPLLVAADVYRPAAIQQLQILGQTISVPVFTIDGSRDPVTICTVAVERARNAGQDVVILDTAGRLHIDDEMMDELTRIKEAVEPHETLLVVDGMTGQDAVNVADTFNQRIGIDGSILTKLDGDARGGAALSIRSVTHKPIKFIGVGEKLDALEPFHPERMASRILGMGDMLSLVERAQAVIDIEEARKLEEKLRKETFDLEDFRTQLRQVSKMGSLDQILEMIPGMNKSALKGVEMDEHALVQMEAIINSMTPAERRRPVLINGSRRRRIARGSGTTVQDVNNLLKQFEMMQKMVKRIGRLSKSGRIGRQMLPF
ncbi:MAG: signal recognition particle protein [Candidatus Latescibacteria bacterium]|nr:signal recognition particle protein [Candidatus Latescibacterota bacterium]